MKRKLSRVDFKIDAVVKADGVEFSSKVTNISLNGAFLETERRLDLGLVVDLSIVLSSLNTDMKVQLKGDVVRLENEGVAVQFKDIELDSFVLLRNIVIYNTGDSSLVDREFEEFIQERNSKR